MSGEIEAPELEDPKDREMWEHMQGVEEAAKRVADRVAEKGGHIGPNGSLVMGG
jgi:hypothetical protein